MAHYDFEKDIIEGEEGEKVVLSDLVSMGAELFKHNDNAIYDLIVTRKGKKTSYEIKTDVLCYPDRDTGNIFIEFESRGKKSGINVTKAKWFVTYFKHFREIWYIKSDDLRKLIEENEFPTTEFSGDAGSNTKGYLINRYKFKDKFIVRKVPRNGI